MNYNLLCYNQIWLLNNLKLKFLLVIRAVSGDWIVSLVDFTDKESISIGTLEVIYVLLTTVEIVRDLSALMVEAEVLLALKFNQVHVCIQNAHQTAE